MAFDAENKGTEQGPAKHVPPPRKNRQPTLASASSPYATTPFSPDPPARCCHGAALSGRQIEGPPASDAGLWRLRPQGTCPPPSPAPTTHTAHIIRCDPISNLIDLISIPHNLENYTKNVCLLSCAQLCLGLVLVFGDLFRSIPPGMEQLVNLFVNPCPGTRI
jgi:hypothetical protein